MKNNNPPKAPSKDSDNKPKPELSRVVNIKSIGHNDYHIKATEAEMMLLAKRFNVTKIVAFKASFNISQASQVWPGYYLQGSVKATVTQSCVKTGDEIITEVDDTFDLYVFDKEYEEEILGSEDFGDEDFEVSEDDMVDLGEVAAQYLSLNIEYHLSTETQEYEDEDEDGINTPFSSLKDLLDKGEKDK